MSELKSSIPKFGSFKPGPGPVIQDQVEKEASKGRDHDQNDSTTRHEPHKSRKTHSKAQKRDTSTEQRSEGARRELVETKQRPLVRENFDERYIVDKSGDVKNLVYGSNHRYSIPPFHRSGAGSVLGVPSFLRIDRNYADESGIFLSDRRGPKSRHREKYIFSRIEKHRSKLLKIRPDVVSQNSVEKDYISFRSSRGGKRKSGSDGGSGTEDGEADYRSVYGKAMPNDELEVRVVRVLVVSLKSLRGLPDLIHLILLHEPHYKKLQKMTARCLNRANFSIHLFVLLLDGFERSGEGRSF